MKKSLIIFCSFLVWTSCATQSKYKDLLFAPWSSYQNDADGRIRAEYKASPTQAEINNQLPSRNTYIISLKMTHKLIEKRAISLFNELRSLANKKSITSLSVSTVGVLSGIAATTLLVASPANIIWVTGLTGLSTGALGYQTRLAQEGFSREAVQREFEKIASEYKDANSEFGDALAILQANLNSTNVTDWNLGVSKAEKSLSTMETLTTLGYLPKGTQEDLNKIKAKDEEILNQIKQLSLQNNELKTKVEALK
jgi:hypothetical protein